MPWLWVVPESIYWAVRHVSDVLKRPDLPLLITENGCATQDELTQQGEILIAIPSYTCVNIYNLPIVPLQKAIHSKDIFFGA